jgi:hypothetical protein
LEGFVADASREQISAWDSTIPALQREANEVLARDAGASGYSTILEYELPLEARRPDVVFLLDTGVVVVELKGKATPSRADLDQAASYVRDLRSYHAACHQANVVGIVVPTHAKGRLGVHAGIQVCGPDALDSALAEVAAGSGSAAPTRAEFLAEDAYSPIPSLIEAARELFHRGTLRRIRRATAQTDTAVHALAEIVHAAAAERSRKLVLLTGLPGTGKTLVGLRLVHADFLNDLAVPHAGAPAKSPAVFLSGNQPLVQVLQYELKGAGGGGKAFVRQVKDYVKHYSSKRQNRPPEHVLVFDEAQRAFDAEQVAAKHKKTPGYGGGKSEPELFIEFAERVNGWCVVLALIGSGQEIHIGEEAGLAQWRLAIEKSQLANWQVIGPPETAAVFAGSAVRFRSMPALHLQEELRYHWATDLHEFVDGFLNNGDPLVLSRLAGALSSAGYHLRVTRGLAQAKDYLRDRYSDDKEARFGVLASSRDKDLAAHGVDNSFNTTKRVRFGPWYADDESKPSSCRRLADCVTEFGAQGLELDAALVAWGTDLQWIDSRWSSEKARVYQEHTRVRDRHRLRVNAYRVLMTRAREAVVVFVPPTRELDATYDRMIASGFLALSEVAS